MLGHEHGKPRCVAEADLCHQPAVGQLCGALRVIVLRQAPPRPGELFRSALDVSKAKAVLKWSPEWKFEDGLRPLVEWFQKEAR